MDDTVVIGNPIESSGKTGLEDHLWKNQMKFKDKIILITGSNRGIGKSILRLFASEGAVIFAHARSYSENFESELNSLKSKFSTSIFPVYFDLRDIPSSRELRESLGNNLKTIDVLVISAAVYHEELFQMASESTLEELFEVNLFSAIKLIQRLIPNLRKSKYPSIIFISSIASLDLEIGNSLYGITKAAVNALTKSLYKELSLYNIRVNTVAPGLVDTDMAKKIEPKVYQKALDKTLLHQPISPDDIAKVVLFLASEDSRIINGEIIRCDGGKI